MKLFLVGAVALLLGFTSVPAYLYFTQPDPELGSVVTGSDYQATTTYAGHNDADGVILLKTGQGSLGSVVITGANTGLMSLYNATTSNPAARAATKASSTILLADFPAGAATTTYIFDVEFTDGLLLVVSGNEATSTITWR